MFLSEHDVISKGQMVIFEKDMFNCKCFPELSVAL